MALAKKQSSFDHPTNTIDDIVLPDLAHDLERAAVVVEMASEEDLKKQQLASLAFAEEPIRVVVHNAMPDPTGLHIADLVSVQGKRIEEFVDGRWVEIGRPPFDRPFITRRKYVETMLRAKSYQVMTVIEGRTEQYPINKVRQTVTPRYHITVLEDRNPAGGEWLRTMTYATV